MGIFAAAALVSFLLYGWIEASKPACKFLRKPLVQLGLGSLALFVLALSVAVLIFQWAECWIYLCEDFPYWILPYEVFLIVQRLTGPEVVQLILGVAFGCVLRYWGPELLAIKREPWTRYNWVAISLVGLILLAAAIPYIERQLGGMTGLKTPFAEFQFETIPRAKRYLFEEQRTSNAVNKMIPDFTLEYNIEPDLEHLEFLLRFLPNNKNFENRMIRYVESEENYKNSLLFVQYIMGPLNLCAWRAYESYLDTESIRHSLGPVAQRLRLLLTQPNRTSNPPQLNVLEKEVMDRLDLLKGALETDEEMCVLAEKKPPQNLKFLSNAPHIYLALALLDGFNDNREGGISMLEKASERFGDEDHSPGILFNIHFTLARHLYDTERDPEKIFRHLDKALKITQDELERIDKWKQLTTNRDRLNKLLEAEKRFKKLKRWSKNFLAYFSAQEGVRKFEALLYAKHNYDDLEQLDQWMQPQTIDTYGYVKMAFALREIPPDFDEIEQAKALLKAAVSHTRSLPEKNRYLRESKLIAKKTIQFHLEQANRLLESQ